MVLVDIHPVMLWLEVEGHKVKPATVRQWATRGLVHRYGCDVRGRVLYDLREVLAVAEARRAGRAA